MRKTFEKLVIFIVSLFPNFQGKIENHTDASVKGRSGSHDDDDDDGWAESTVKQTYSGYSTVTALVTVL